MRDRCGFSLSDLGSRASISRGGAVLLGTNFTVDAHHDRPVRVATHAHADHLLGLEESLARCERVVMTPATLELVEAIYRRPLRREGVELLGYGEGIAFGEERLTLFEAGHIVGSAQVLVESERGERLVYTGDFKLPGAKVVESDVLVMEATYGNPNCTRPFKDLVERELVDLVERGLRDGPVYIFGYHGKLQEVAGILRGSGLKEPIVMPRQVYEVARICVAHGMELGDFLLDDSEEGKEALKGPHVGLYHMRRARRFEGLGMRVYLSGWEFEVPVRRVGEGEYQVALSDHSDFEELLRYVEESGPRLVITDDFRVGDARALAREIRRRLGIPAKPMP